MAIETIINTPENSGQGDSLKVAFDKVNNNFSYVSEIIETLPTGSTVTKTSELENDGDGDSPFATVSQIPTSFPISGVTGLQQELNLINEELDTLDSVPSDINSINSTISSLNSIINTQNQIISELQSAIANLPQPQPEQNYKVYTALMAQNGTNAPVVTVLENTLGGDIVWTYVSTGRYFGTLNGAFIENKTFLLSSVKTNSDVPFSEIHFSRWSVNSVQILQFSEFVPTNAFDNFSIEIRVYN